MDFPIRKKINNTWSGPHKKHLYQVRSQSLPPFLRREKVKNVSAKQRPRRPSWIFRSARKVTTLVRDLMRNMCTRFGVDTLSHSRQEAENVSANPSPSNGGHLGFLRITRKVTTLVRDVIRNNCTEFGVDPFSCSSNGDEMVSANQNARHGGHLGFSDPHKN